MRLLEPLDLLLALALELLVGVAQGRAALLAEVLKVREDGRELRLRGLLRLLRLRGEVLLLGLAGLRLRDLLVARPHRGVELGGLGPGARPHLGEVGRRRGGLLREEVPGRVQRGGDLARVDGAAGARAVRLEERGAELVVHKADRLVQDLDREVVVLLLVGDALLLRRELLLHAHLLSGEGVAAQRRARDGVRELLGLELRGAVLRHVPVRVVLLLPLLLAVLRELRGAEVVRALLSVLLRDERIEHALDLRLDVRERVQAHLGEGRVRQGRRGGGGVLGGALEDLEELARRGGRRELEEARRRVLREGGAGERAEEVQGLPELRGLLRPELLLGRRERGVGLAGRLDACPQLRLAVGGPLRRRLLARQRGALGHGHANVQLRGLKVGLEVGDLLLLRAHQPRDLLLLRGPGRVQLLLLLLHVLLGRRRGAVLLAHLEEGHGDRGGRRVRLEQLRVEPLELLQVRRRGVHGGPLLQQALGDLLLGLRDLLQRLLVRSLLAVEVLLELAELALRGSDRPLELLHLLLPGGRLGLRALQLGRSLRAGLVRVLNRLRLRREGVLAPRRLVVLHHQPRFGLVRHGRDERLQRLRHAADAATSKTSAVCIAARFTGTPPKLRAASGSERA